MRSKTKYILYKSEWWINVIVHYLDVKGWNLVLPKAAAATEVIGSYPVWPLFIVFAVAIVLPLLFISLKPQELRPVYMCGEQAGDVDTDEWYCAADVKTKLQLGGYYYKDAIGEEAINPWVYVIAIALLVIMFGVVGVSI
jgi:ech hydrogenase subunit A